MRAADLISVIVALVLAGGGIAGFFYWKQETARAEDARYEAGLDDMLDRKMRSVWLRSMEPALAARDDNLAALRALYSNDLELDRLNLGFGTLRGDWPASYAAYAETAGREVERDRLPAEIDERFGAGAFALMTENYDHYLANVERRAQELAERRDRDARAVIEYFRRTGRMPRGPFRIENGRVVEE